MNLIAMLPHDEHKHKVYRTIKDIYGRDNICYVSVNRPKQSLLPVIEEWIDIQYLYLLDAVTKTVLDDPEPMTNGAYISSPGAFDEIYSHVDRLLASRRFGALIFDSLCTLPAYRTEEEVRQFVNRMLARVSLAPCEGIFMCVEPSVKSWYVEELHKVADRVVRLE